MNVNTKLRYGLRVMIELALHEGNSGMLQKDIAEAQDLSIKYLDQIIATLKTAGLIENIKGKKSGYRLSKVPEKITVYDILSAFESRPINIDCLTEETRCEKSNQCAAQQFWNDLNRCINNFTMSAHLKDLITNQKKLDT